MKCFLGNFSDIHSLIEKIRDQLKREGQPRFVIFSNILWGSVLSRWLKSLKRSALYLQLLTIWYTRGNVTGLKIVHLSNYWYATKSLIYIIFSLQLIKRIQLNGKEEYYFVCLFKCRGYVHKLWQNYYFCLILDTGTKTGKHFWALYQIQQAWGCRAFWCSLRNFEFKF